jgi:hypothetical protein
LRSLVTEFGIEDVMDALIAALVAAGFVVLIGLFLIRVRRIEREVDFGEFGKDRHDDRLAYLARVVANTTVASP